MVRHFINGHDAGKKFKTIAWSLGLAILAFVAAVSVSGLRLNSGTVVTGVSDQEIQTIVDRHCVACHSATPTHEFFEEAPAGLQLDDLAELYRFAEQVRVQAVIGQTMPLGNENAMTQEEREKLGLWLDQQTEN